MRLRTRSRWAEDKLAHARYLRLRGLRGRKLKIRLERLELQEERWSRFIPDEPLAPQLKESQGPAIDYAWLLGLTCSDRFSRMSYSDRLILYHLYHEGSPRAVASIMRMTKRNVNKRLERMRDK